MKKTHCALGTQKQLVRSQQSIWKLIFTKHREKLVNYRKSTQIYWSNGMLMCLLVNKILLKNWKNDKNTA